MHFSTIIATALLGASTTMAVPAIKRNQILCPGIEGTPQCCAANELGVANLNCAPPPMVPKDIKDFTEICASIGQQAQCCALPVLGQALLCESPP